jgi:hypothetical protein
MADHLDVGRSAWPEHAPSAPAPVPSPLRPIGGRPPRFGVAHDLEVLQRAAASGDASRLRSTTARPVTAPAAAVDRAWDRLRTWWACRESRPVDVWHRLMCRLGRHDVQGGQRIQVGGRYVNTERRCVWCATPG